MAIYISLGATCSVRYNLQKLNKINCTLPFDWIRCPNFNKIIELIENEFEDFCDNLEFKKISNTHPTLTNDNDEIEKTEIKHSAVYSNSKYDITFFHDFAEKFESTTDPIYLEFKEKYNRRIKRFYELIKNNEIIFIRDEPKLNHMTPEMIHKFHTTIAKYTTNYKLIIIIQNPKQTCNPLLFDSEFDKTIIINDKKKFETWHRSNFDWSSVIE